MSLRDPRGTTRRKQGGGLGWLGALMGAGNITGGEFVPPETVEVAGPTPTGEPLRPQVIGKPGFTRPQVQHPTLDAIFNRGRGGMLATQMDARQQELLFQAQMQEQIAQLANSGAIDVEQLRGLNQANVAKIGNEGQLANTRLSNEGQLAVTDLTGKNQLAVEGVRGTNQLADTRLRNEGQLENTRLSGRNQLMSDRTQGRYQLLNTRQTGANQIGNTRAMGEESRLTQQQGNDLGIIGKIGIPSAGLNAYNMQITPKILQQQGNELGTLADYSATPEGQMLIKQNYAGRMQAPVAENISKSTVNVQPNTSAIALLGKSGQTPGEPYVMPGVVSQENIEMVGGFPGPDGTMYGGQPKTTTTYRQQMPYEPNVIAAKEEQIKRLIAEQEAATQAASHQQLLDTLKYDMNYLEQLRKAEELKRLGIKGAGTGPQLLRMRSVE